MKQSISIKKRKELENKMTMVFENEMKAVPVALRKIMADDLVSAFENRVFALNRAQLNLKFFAITDGEVQVETV
jgi:uncharacterized protein (DUF2461 family)